MNEPRTSESGAYPVLVETNGKMHMVGEDGRCECGSSEPVRDGVHHPNWAGIFCVECHFPVVYVSA